MRRSHLVPLVCAAGLLLTGCAHASGKQDSHVTEYRDTWGRVCTQVDPPGDTIALDCDWPPSTNSGERKP